MATAGVTGEGEIVGMPEGVSVTDNEVGGPAFALCLFFETGCELAC